MIARVALYFLLIVCAVADEPDEPACATTMAPLTAAVLGATGAVGKEVVRHLSARPSWTRIIVLNRREVEYADSKVEQHVVKMDEATLEADTARILGNAGADAVFNTMGVGAASKADEATLRKVDVGLPSAFFKGAKAAGVRHASLLTAVGADASANPDSGWFFVPKTAAGGPLYNHLKGVIEQRTATLNFASSSAFRPAALIGTPHTPKFIALVSPVFDRIVPAKYKSSNINTLAAAMVHDAETKLGALDDAAAVGAGDGTVAGANAFPADAHTIFEGANLHELYARVPFQHGKVGGK